MYMPGSNSPRPAGAETPIGQASSSSSAAGFGASATSATGAAPANRPVSFLSAALYANGLRSAPVAHTSNSNSSSAAEPLDFSDVKPVYTQRLKGYLHTTNSANLPAIHEEGLVGGKTEGIGTPGGSRSANVFVVDDPSNYKGNRLSGEVGVLSARSPQPDTNYLKKNDPGRGFGAGHFGSAVAPLRLAMTDDHGSQSPYSFTLPMTPQTEEGAARLFNALEGSTHTPGSAGRAAIERVQETHHLAFPQLPNKASGFTPPSSSSSLSPVAPTLSPLLAAPHLPTAPTERHSAASHVFSPIDSQRQTGSQAHPSNSYEARIFSPLNIIENYSSSPSSGNNHSGTTPSSNNLRASSALAIPKSGTGHN